MEIINVTGINPLIKAIEVYDQDHINFLRKNFGFPKITYTYEDRFISQSGVYTENVISLHKLKYVHFDEFKYEYYKLYWNCNRLRIYYTDITLEEKIEEILINLEGWSKFRKTTYINLYNIYLSESTYQHITGSTGNIIDLTALQFINMVNDYKKYKSLKNIDTIDNMLNIIKEIEDK